MAQPVAGNDKFSRIEDVSNQPSELIKSFNTLDIQNSLLYATVNSNQSVATAHATGDIELVERVRHGNDILFDDTLHQATIVGTGTYMVTATIELVGTSNTSSFQGSFVDSSDTLIPVTPRFGVFAGPSHYGDSNSMSIIIVVSAGSPQTLKLQWNTAPSVFRVR